MYFSSPWDTEPAARSLQYHRSGEELFSKKVRKLKTIKFHEVQHEFGDFFQVQANLYVLPERYMVLICSYKLLSSEYFTFFRASSQASATDVLMWHSPWESTTIQDFAALGRPPQNITKPPLHHESSYIIWHARLRSMFGLRMGFCCCHCRFKKFKGHVSLSGCELWTPKQSQPVSRPLIVVITTCPDLGRTTPACFGHVGLQACEMLYMLRSKDTGTLSVPPWTSEFNSKLHEKHPETPRSDMYHSVKKPNEHPLPHVPRECRLEMYGFDHPLGPKLQALLRCNLADLCPTAWASDRMRVAQVPKCRKDWAATRPEMPDPTMSTRPSYGIAAAVSISSRTQTLHDFTLVSCQKQECNYHAEKAVITPCMLCPMKLGEIWYYIIPIYPV